MTALATPHCSRCVSTAKLLFATDRDTRMVVDTLVVAKTNLFQIGTSEHPVQDGVTADIVNADNVPIDVMGSAVTEARHHFTPKHRYARPRGDVVS